MNKNSRALIAITNLATVGDPKFLWLYQFIDASGAVLADALATSYGTYSKLTGANATKAKFLDAIKKACAKTAVKKVDVIINLHGSSGKLHFPDTAITSAKLATAIKALPGSSKLRLLYSTACFGNTHATDLRKAGFDAAVGAIGVNANAATEYPTVLTMWAAGSKIKDAVAAGENILTRAPADAAAGAAGFQNVNSDKNIHGSSQITINS